MQEGAGVGRKKSDARIPSVQRGLSASATLPVLNGFDQDPADIRRCFLAFLPGSGLQVECDVTYSKQTTAPFLPGSRIAPHGLRQGTAFHAELRSAAAPNASQSSGVHTLVAEATPEVRCHARTSIANALSNRELQLLESRLIHRKQTIAPRSNRELSTNRCRVNSPAVTPIPSFLPGSGLQVECDVTHSNQTPEPFLPGSRIVTKRLVSRTVFHPVSSELFPTRRRISLQDGIAHNRLVAASPRMHALVGRP
jgi:hypothetical protein